LTTRKLSQYANLADGTEARTLIRRLNEYYDASGRPSAWNVCRRLPAADPSGAGQWVRRLQHAPPELRLSAPALETLAVIAYRQPVLRADIEAVRGVNCGELLRQLMDRDLVRIGGRSPELGRPFLYATTKRFLQVFGLESLEQLPRVAALQAAAGTDIPPSGTPSAGGETCQEHPERVPVHHEEKSHMPMLTLSSLELERPFPGVPEDEALGPRLAKTFDEDEGKDEFESFEDDEEDEDEAEAEEDAEAEDDDFEEDEEDEFEDEFEDEEEDDEEFEDDEEEEDDFEDEEDDVEWEEVDDEDWEDDEEDDEDEEEDWGDEDEEETRAKRSIESPLPSSKSPLPSRWPAGPVARGPPGCDLVRGAGPGS